MEVKAEPEVWLVLVSPQGQLEGALKSGATEDLRCEVYYLLVSAPLLFCWRRNRITAPCKKP